MKIIQLVCAPRDETKLSFGHFDPSLEFHEPADCLQYDRPAKIDTGKKNQAVSTAQAYTEQRNRPVECTETFELHEH